MTELSILIAGVGGQGTLLTGRILGQYASLLGLDAKVSEVHGMAQRGGCVVTHFKMAPCVRSPLIEEGQADALLAFEPLEALRWLHMLKPSGTLVAAQERIPPLSVTMGLSVYPDDVFGLARQKVPNAHFVPAGELCMRAGDARTANVVLLGVLTRVLNLDRDNMLSSIEACVKPSTLPVNRKAFALGLQATTPME
jgi:indolepyruvate ferredoxin oxidoreductase beta subunit